MVPRIQARPEPGMSLARFMAARGRRVFEALGVVWGEYRPPFFMSLPDQRRVDLDAGELGSALRKEHAWAARHPTLTQRGWPGGIFACRPSGYSLDSVDPAHRRQVRRGLERCEVRPVTLDELRAGGLELNLDTMARQHRFDPDFGDPGRWAKLVDAIGRCPELAVAGAFFENRLSSYLISCLDGSWLHILYKMSRSAELIHRTNPALDFQLLTEAAKLPGLEGVSYGFVSTMSGGDPLARYKLAMGYSIDAHEVRFQFHPAVATALTNPVLVGAVTRLARRWPGNHQLDLAANVLEGARRSLQTHPPDAPPADPR